MFCLCFVLNYNIFLYLSFYACWARVNNKVSSSRVSVHTEAICGLPAEEAANLTSSQPQRDPRHAGQRSCRTARSPISDHSHSLSWSDQWVVCCKCGGETAGGPAEGEEEVGHAGPAKCFHRHRNIWPCQACQRRRSRQDWRKSCSLQGRSPPLCPVLIPCSGSRRLSLTKGDKTAEEFAESLMESRIGFSAP